MSLEMLRPSGISVSRSFRLDRTFSELLMEEAEKKGMNFSSLIGKIVKDYLTIHVYADRYPLVMLSQPELEAIMASLSEEQAAALGREMGSTTPINVLLMRGMNTDLESVIWLLDEVYGRRMGWFSVYDNVVEDERVLHFTHRLSKNWTAFLGSYISAMFDSVLDLDVSQEHRETFVTVKIPLSS